MSVDVETSGPSPSRHSLLAIGACLVQDVERTFYVELQPAGMGVDPEAVAVSALSLDRLAAEGVAPAEAMQRFAEWLMRVVPTRSRPVFVALNAPFDWMFVADYFHRYLDRNPFGHSALDMKALFLGTSGKPWLETSLSDMARRYGLDFHLSHHALEDAVLQAQVFRHIMAERSEEELND